MPSVYFLREDVRQAMVAVFNWTEGPRSHTLALPDLGLSPGHTYRASDVLNGSTQVTIAPSNLAIKAQAPHSVALIKIVDSSAAENQP
jgi:hypothetical protein